MGDAEGQDGNGAVLRGLVDGLAHVLRTVEYTRHCRPKLREFSGNDEYGLDEFLQD